MRFYAVFVATFLVASLTVESTLAHYRRLNNYLVAQVKDDEVGPNLEAAAKWLKGQEGKKLSFLSSTPISDLKKFTALQQVVDDTKCDHVAHEIMLANDEASGLYKLGDAAATRRVDKVILKIFQDHAARCYKVYQKRSHEMVEQVPDQKVERVVDVSKALMEKDKFVAPDRAFYQPKILYNEYVKKAISVRRYIGTNALKDAVIASAKNDPDVRYLRKVPDDRTGKAIVHKDKIEGLVQKYVIEPCKQYTDLLGPDLFIPADFDVRFHRDSEISWGNPDYYLTRASFRICKALIEYDGVVVTDVTLSVSNGN